MNNFFRFQEYKILAYRIFLVYFFYFTVRCLFVLYNLSSLQIESIGAFLRLCYYGLAFDTTAILYVNSLFILLSILPLKINTNTSFQKSLFYLYFVTNLVAFATNFIDFIYYRHTYTRTTSAVMDVLKNETNKSDLLFKFLTDFWHVFTLFFLISYLWIYLYRLKKLVLIVPSLNFKYFLYSTLGFLIIATFAIGGIRGDLWL